MRFLPAFALAAILLLVFLLAVLPAWALAILATMAGALVLAGFASLMAITCRPALRLLHEHRDKQAAREVMRLQARAQAAALRASKLPGKYPQTSIAPIPATTERTLSAAGCKGRVCALLAQGKTNHAIVVSVWGVAGGRAYQSAMAYVQALRSEYTRALPPAPAPRALAEPRQVATYAAELQPAAKTTARRRKGAN